MEKTVNIATDLTNETFHFTRTAIYSFLQSNPWFNGKIYYLTKPTSEISSQNLILLKKLYANIELSDNTSYIENSPVFYFRNYCLFIKDISKLLNNSFITHNLDLFFINSDVFEFKALDNLVNAAEIPTLSAEYYSYSSELSDRKFKNTINFIPQASIILFDSEKNESTKIQQVWLQKNKEALQYLDKPLNVSRNSQMENSKSGKLHISKITKTDISSKLDYPNPLTKDIIEKINQKAGVKVFESAIALVNYLKDKNICLIANSAELLKYNHGNFIDSHDIIIRFNGYEILEDHTGTRTDIHCVFRDYINPSTGFIDYKLIISSNISKWFNSITKHHATDAILRQYKLIDFNYPTQHQLNRAKCSNIRVPTSGLATFIFLQNLGLAKNIKLFGFNGYLGGKSSSILRSNNDFTLADAHNYKLESEYWSTHFNEVLPGVLKYKYI